MEGNKIKGRIAFIVGRPSGHPLHMAYGESVDSDVYHEDRILRWQDVEGASKARRYLSWILNAIFFPNRKRYDLFLCECLRVPPLLMKCCGLLTRNQKLVALMADESLYFLDQKKYPLVTRWLMRLFLKKCDHLICIGALQYELALRHAPKGSEKKIHQIENGIDAQLLERLLKIHTPKRPMRKLVIIANLSASWRAWYKGVDLAFKAFDHQCISSNLNLTLDVIGEVNEGVANDLLKGISEENKSRISFKGMVSDIASILPEYDLCLHPSRGDAYPTSTLECFAAGIPTIVSNVTGTKSFLSNICEQLICEPYTDSLIKSIDYALQLSDDERNEFSKSLKNAVSGSTEEHSLNEFRKIMNQILSEN
ncbi:MAG: putative glycosyltransferase, type 1 [Bacteroidota bacterium]